MANYKRVEARVNFADQEACWQKRLGGDLPILELPSDHPRPPVQSFIRASEAIEIDEKSYSELKKFCSREDVTLFTTLLASFKILLLRYTGQEDLIVGSLCSDSIREGKETGPEEFVNLIGLRTNLTGDPSAKELLRRVAHTVEEAYENRDYPFEKLLGYVESDQNLTRAPIFQVLLALSNVPLCISEAPISEENLGAIDEHAVRCDLVFIVSEEEESLHIRCEYDAKLFESVSIIRMLGHLRALLESIVTNPDQSISILPFLTEAEQHQLLVEWNDTKRDYSRGVCVHQLFEAQVDRSPDAVAVVFENEQLTYQELNRRANQLARYLQKLGVGPDVLVGICLERSPEMIIALIGVLKAGGAFVPLEPTYPKERLAFMLNDAALSTLITREYYISNFFSLECEIVCIDSNWKEINKEIDKNPVRSLDPDNLAYVIYTSGSTGKPKGAMITHKGLVNYLTWCSKVYSVCQGDGVPVYSSIGFDFTMTCVFSPILIGQKLILIPEGKEIDTLSKALSNDSNFSFLKITPSHLRLLNCLLKTNSMTEPAKLLILGGEALSAEILNLWNSKIMGIKIINEYGPTETVVGCCTYELPSVTMISSSVPIGRPIHNTEIYILDTQLKPVPIWVSGELHISGLCLARSYLNRPELTADKFIPNPFSKEPGKRLYKTGDICRYLPDGNIEFMGRIDNQVKIRGHRIEVAEIEMTLLEHDAVKEVVVVAREDPRGDQHLVAYLVPNAWPAPTVSELRGFLTQKLPDYMVPSAFVFLDALPLTPNRKVDRRALPAPDRTRPEPGETFVAPRTQMESLIAEIWKEVLGVDQVGVYDNFFDLGGHSLLTMQVTAQLENKLGLRVNPGELMLQTLGQLASALEERKPVLIKSKPMNLTQNLKSAFKETVFFRRDDLK